MAQQVAAAGLTGLVFPKQNSVHLSGQSDPPDMLQLVSGQGGDAAVQSGDDPAGVLLLGL